MIAVIVNALSVIAGSLAGLFIKKGVKPKIEEALMQGLGLCTMAIGIGGVLKGENTLMMILSVVLGTFIGTLLNLEGLLEIGAAKLGKLFGSGDAGNFAEGFVSASLLFCVGAMAVVGSLQAGLSQNYDMLFTKSCMDGIAAILLTSALGIGVLFSAAFVLVFQGIIVLCAQWAAPLLSVMVVNEITCVGSVLILGVALNLLKLKQIKVMNMLPALLIPVIFALFIR